jgi:hypothetical protein
MLSRQSICLREVPPCGTEQAPAHRHGRGAHYDVDQVGYFLSPLDFLKECLTFFRFKAAFKRFVFFRLFMFSSIDKSLSYSVTTSLNHPAASVFSFLWAIAS